MQGHTQLAQRAMSAHDMGVEMASYKGLSTLESGSKSQSWHAASKPSLGPFASFVRLTFADAACNMFCGSVIVAQLYCSLNATCDAKSKKSLHAGSFVQRSIDVTAGQEYTRAQPRHADSGVLHEHDLVRSATLCCPVLHSTKNFPLQSSERSKWCAGNMSSK